MPGSVENVLLKFQNPWFPPFSRVPGILDSLLTTPEYKVYRIVYSLLQSARYSSDSLLPAPEYQVYRYSLLAAPEYQVYRIVYSLLQSTRCTI